jgi:hypothetical protein
VSVIGWWQFAYRPEDCKTEEKPNVVVHYLEIVSNDADTLTALYRRMHGLSFGPPDPDLGQARVATQADGAALLGGKCVAE